MFYSHITSTFSRLNLRRWFGTYPVLPTYVQSTGEDLQELLDSHPDELVGKSLQQKFGHTKLPYLPKVLSISKALPLQLHPNKSKAAELHKRNPNQFTDPNHKPEIAIALTKFEAFCGFKPLNDIAALFQLKPLQPFLPETSAPNFTDESLRHVVQTILSASPDTIASAVTALSQLPASTFGIASYIAPLLPRLQQQYETTDPGTLVALITMNYVVLPPGAALSIPADGIHAYLAGDIIECMARSNNVLNTGFCPAASRDNVDEFVEVLSFAPHDPMEAILPLEEYKGSSSGKTMLYAPPMSEFNMLATELESGEEERIAANEGPGIFVVTKGEASMKARDKEVDLREGGVWFVAPGVATDFQAGMAGLQMFRAYAE